MLSLPVPPAILLLTLACLLTAVLTLWVLAAADRAGEATQRIPAANAALPAFVRMARSDSLRGRAHPRPTPSRVRPGGRGAARRRRSRRGRSD